MKSNLYFKRDLYAVENDRQLRHLCKTYPVWGEAVFFNAVCMMYRVDGQYYAYDDLVMDVMDSLYTDNQENIERILDSCISFGLFQMKDKMVWSNRVRNTCLEQMEFRRKQSEKGKKSAEKRATASANNAEKSNSGSTTVKQVFNGGSTYNQDQDQDNITNVSKEPLVGENLVSPDTENEEKSDDFELTGDEKATTVSTTIPYKKVCDYWNTKLNGLLPQVKFMTDTRKTLIRQRWNEHKNDVFTAIDKVAQSDFVCHSENNWCSFDWVFKKSNMVNILEGKYDNKTAEVKPAKHKDYSDIGKQSLEGFSWET